MKKSILAITILFLSFMSFSEESFKSISLVTFRTGLEYTIGQNSQAYTAQRRLSPFSINKYETPYALWYQIRTTAEEMGYYFANPGQPGSAGKRAAIPDEETLYQPVTTINWYDAIIWCNALSEIKGRTPCYTYNGEILRDSSDTATCDLAVCNWEANGFRLPSEAEWEYAARRTKTGFQRGNLVSGQNSAETEDGLLYAWTNENSGGTRIIGTAGTVFDPNVLVEPATGNANSAGLYDMSGNVMELCWDWFADYSEDAPTGPKLGYERTARGGSWSPYTMFVYCGDRYSFDPNETYNYFGFRFACTASPAN